MSDHALRQTIAAMVQFIVPQSDLHRLNVDGLPSTDRAVLGRQVRTLVQPIREADRPGDRPVTGTALRWLRVLFVTVSLAGCFTGGTDQGSDKRP